MGCPAQDLVWVDWLTDCTGPLYLCVTWVKSTAVGMVRQMGTLGSSSVVASGWVCCTVPVCWASPVHCIVSAFFLLFFFDCTSTFAPGTGGGKSLYVVVSP